MSRPRGRFARLMAVALAFGLVGALLGGGLVLVDVWRRADVLATTTEQASVFNPADTDAQAAR
jgi:hypothetical protein